MNSFERKELKNIKKSRDKWRQKAVERSRKLHDVTQNVRDLTKSRANWRDKYTQAADELEKEKSKPATSIVPSNLDEKQIYVILVSLCLNLTINCSVSFRAVPKILSVFKDVFKMLSLPFKLRIPHFSTITGWMLRTGKYLLERALKPLSKPWICIVDHTIQVGIKKAFVVLRVPAAALRSIGALTFKDIEVLHLEVQKKSNGEIIRDILTPLFQKAGYPVQIVMDKGSDLNKGIRLIAQTLKSPFKLTYDLTHLISGLLKKKYSCHTVFNELLSKMNLTKNKIRQTVYAFLTPLKERGKSKYLHLPSIVKWTEQIINYLKIIPAEKQKEKFSDLKLHFAWVMDYIDFLKDFSLEIQSLTKIQKLLKKCHLNELSFKKVLTVINGIADNAIKTPLLEYINAEFNYSTPYPLLLTSDIIESLFGKYKYIAKPNSMSEINRMILALPCITEDITPNFIQQAFAHTHQKDVELWVKKNIGSTMRSKRRKALTKKLIL